MKRKTLPLALLICLPFYLTGCVSIPDGIEPVTNFELDRYLGKWYEIARLDHSFERGMENVTAEYSLREDGGVRVMNRGYLKDKEKWKEAEGKAYFVESDDLAYLKVSFFGPFYGSYVVFHLERDHYDYAFVAGPNTSYLWLLSRKPEVSDEVFAEFQSQARLHGFELDEMILVNHDPVGSVRQ